MPSVTLPKLEAPTETGGGAGLLVAQNWLGTALAGTLLVVWQAFSWPRGA
jgi:hypothetical protein